MTGRAYLMESAMETLSRLVSDMPVWKKMRKIEKRRREKIQMMVRGEERVETGRIG